jgi:hypothetical protein
MDPAEHVSLSRLMTEAEPGFRNAYFISNETMKKFKSRTGDFSCPRNGTPFFGIITAYFTDALLDDGGQFQQKQSIVTKIGNTHNFSFRA